MHVAYVRVSSVEQNEARQLEAMKKYPIEKFFREKISGKNTDRPELQRMLEFVREGDVVHVHDFSRLARSTKDLLELVDFLTQKGVTLVSNKESLDTSTATGKLMLTMIGAVNEFERASILERQREGIAIQKELDKSRPPSKRKYKGRKAIQVDNFDAHYERYRTRQISKSALAKELGISRPTLNKLLQKYEIQ